MVATIAHHGNCRPVPVEVRPHLGATVAAGLAHKPRLEIGQPEIVGPTIPADRQTMAAVVVGAVDQDAAHAALAHLGKGDFLRTVGLGHAP